MTLIKYKKILEKNLEKIQNLLGHKKFKGMRHCGCLNCFEDYECFNSAFYNLLHKFPKTINLVRAMKNEKKKDKNDMFYLRSVSVILEKIQQLQNSFYLPIVEE